MKFGSVPATEARGHVLAHSVQAGAVRLRKGQVLTEADIVALCDADITRVTVARMGAGDLDENAAATMLADALGAHGFEITAPFTGRVNLSAPGAGVLRVDADAVQALNAVDEAITLATLPDFARLAASALVATIKIIPYGVPRASIEAAIAALHPPVLRFHPFRMRRADLILTRTPGMKESLMAKAEAVTGARLSGIGMDLGQVVHVDHTQDAAAQAMRAAGGDMVLILGASATSDRADVIPAALEQAGGRVDRFGMPVDPGNLLMLGALAGRPVVGLPGCARSPALNGADWVLERLAAGLNVTGADIARMGVGGLLKEIPQRAHPRKGRKAQGKETELLLLAAGSSRRMRGQDKLLRDVDGVPLLRRAAEAALSSKAARVRVVLPPGADARRAALAGLTTEITEAPDWTEGMAASLRAGMRDVAAGTSAVVIALADMPEVTPEHYNRVIAAFDPAEGREICRAETAGGVPGHPVLFGARFFELLAALTDDKGAREVLEANRDFAVSVPTPGDGATIDLDTREAWAAWEAQRER